MATGLCFGAQRRAAAQSSYKPIRAVRKTIEVSGKPADILGFEAPNLNLVEGGRFSVQLTNELSEGTIVHWHGLTPPSAFDGSHLSQGIIKHGSSFEYDFVVSRSGTHWMHSHVGLQLQKLMAAPLIVRSLDDLAVDEQEHVMIIQDFTFRDPEEILAELKAGKGLHADHGAPSAAPMVSMNDVNFDAYLANERTLEDPEILRVEAGGRVRLRVINASSASNVLVDFGGLIGELIAIDGNAIESVTVGACGLACAQRADVRIQLPPGQGVFPVVARAEGTRMRTGIILATAQVSVPAISSEGDMMPAVTDVAIEARLKAKSGLPPKSPDRIETIDLGGGDHGYDWNINGNTDHSGVVARVARGQRIEWILRNQTKMAHPMHLHGHHFQIVAVGPTRIDGAMRDTVLVPGRSEVTIAFDADNPGLWPFHCHQLYHFNSGMTGVVEYEG